MRRDTRAVDAILTADERGYVVMATGVLRSPTGVIRKLTTDPGGYLRFTIRIGRRRDNKTSNIYIHQLAGYQKFGDAALEEGIVVRHMNGQRDDNRPANLEIGTNSDNMIDQDEDVRIRKAKHAASFMRKLTEAEVAHIRRESANGAKGIALATMFGVAESTISNIINNRTYVQESSTKGE